MKTYKKNLSSLQITLLGIVLGIRIVLGFIPGFKLGSYVEMGIGFIGAAFSGVLFGPFYAMVIGIINDIISALLTGKSFFFGYTLSAAIGGLIYGWGLWRKPLTFKRIFFVILMITLIVNIGLGSLWVKMMTGKAWAVFMGPRVLKNIISLFLNSVVLFFIFQHRVIKQYITKYQF